MQSYFLALISTAFLAALVGLLAPGGGLAKYIKLLTSLLLLCVLLSPIQDAIPALQAFLNGEWELPELDLPNEDSYKEELNQALEGASTLYFTQMLTQTLQAEFAIDAEDLRCDVRWSTENEALRPTRVTVILSGRAIWKDPEAIERFVKELLECDCVCAIE